MEIDLSLKKTNKNKQTTKKRGGGEYHHHHLDEFLDGITKKLSNGSAVNTRWKTLALRLLDKLPCEGEIDTIVGWLVFKGFLCVQSICSHSQ